MPTLKSLVSLAADNLYGAEWYNAAIVQIETVCDGYNWGSDKFTGILAVTSPRVSVRRNCRIALHYAATGELFSNVMTTIRRSVDHYTKTGAILGPKTGPFYRALRGDTSAIVLDVHMADLLAVKQATFSRQCVRDECESIVRRVAESLAIAPRDAQACLWCGQVKRRGRRPESLPIVQENANMRAHGAFPATGKIGQLGCADGSYQFGLF